MIHRRIIRQWKTRTLLQYSQGIEGIHSTKDDDDVEEAGLSKDAEGSKSLQPTERKRRGKTVTAASWKPHPITQGTTVRLRRFSKRLTLISLSLYYSTAYRLRFRAYCTVLLPILRCNLQSNSDRNAVNRIVCEDPLFLIEVNKLAGL